MIKQKIHIKLVFLFFIMVFISFSSLSVYSQEDDSGAIEETTDKIAKTVDRWGDYLLHRDQDTAFIVNMSDRWAVNLIAINRFNFFQLIDNINNSRITYRPELGINLGAGVSYRWFALSITFNAFKENKELIEGESFDFQAKVFSSKQLISFAIQNYYGYAISQTSGFNTILSEEEKQRNDVRTMNLSLHWSYAFNNEKYSIKAPFVFNERQQKSAGSIITGIGLNFFVMDGDSILIPKNVQDEFDPQIYLTDLNTLNIVLRIGYSYTFTISKYFFVSLGILPGMVINRGDYRTDYRHQMNTNVSWSINTMNAIGYNGDKFFGGIQFCGDMYNVRTSKELGVNIGQGSFKFLFGYRFKKRNK